MGMEIIRLGDKQSKPLSPAVSQNLAELSFSTHHIQQPPLSIWMLSAAAERPLVPWWGYSGQIDDDVKRLNDLWSVSSAQSFFDCLFLSQFKRAMGPNLYAIVPGYLRTEGWNTLPDMSRNAYLRGQGCVYRLEGAFKSKLSINWVPFAQPQCVIKDPSFEALWPMFVASRNDDVANSIGFFSISDVRKLPQAVSLLIQPNENRSIDLSNVVDWFGVYSSPISPDHSSCAVVYAKEKSTLAQFSNFQSKFQTLMAETRSTLLSSPTPHTAFRILSRFVAI